MGAKAFMNASISEKELLWSLMSCKNPKSSIKHCKSEHILLLYDVWHKKS